MTDLQLATQKLSGVTTERFFPDSVLPLVISPISGELDLVEWISDGDNMHQVEQLALIHGGVLFRGFGAITTDTFFRFCRSFTHALLDYTEQSSPRERLGDKVYTSTTYPADQYIPFHNANSFGHEFPMNIWFSCIRDADEGGRTPISDTRRVLANLSEQTRELFRNKGILYYRNYYPAMGVPWEETFDTDSPEEAEAFMHAGRIAYKWKTEGDPRILTTRQVRHAVIAHPKTGEDVWFNQAHLFHRHSMHKRLMPLTRQFSDERLPRHAAFGDGTPIPDAVVDEIFAAYQEAELSFDWQEGDVLMLDNLLTAHARTPFKGDQRLIAVAFSEMFTDYEPQFQKYGIASLAYP
jgi:alpha-ketoglutarate-dependent taurine dioxygenase